MNGDLSKIYTWYHTINPMLGEVTPVSMLLSGKTARILKALRPVDRS